MSTMEKHKQIIWNANKYALQWKSDSVTTSLEGEILFFWGCEWFHIQDLEEL